MKKSLRIIGIFFVLLLIMGFMGKDSDQPSELDRSTSSINETAEPQPTLLPDWVNWSLEEKFAYDREIFDYYSLESDWNVKPEKSYSRAYYMLVYDSIRKEITEKYDVAFHKKTRINMEYLLFDFDEHDFILLYKSKYGRHYGKFTGTENTDWKLIENEDPMIDPWTLRRKGKSLYYVGENGELSDSGYKLCDMEEPMKYIFD